MAQYETGVRVPKSKTLESLAKLFGVSPAALSTPDLNTPEGLMHTFLKWKICMACRCRTAMERFAL